MNFIQRLSKKKSVIILMIISVIGMLLIFTQYFGVFPLEDKYALDMLNYYTKTQFFNNLELMDESSRVSYIMIHIGDYLFMTGFYQLLAVAIYKLLQKPSKLAYVFFVPYLAFFFDFMENLMMDIHIIIYPAQIVVFGSIAGVSTFLKFMSLYLSMLIIIVSIIYKFTLKNKTRS